MAVGFGLAGALVLLLGGGLIAAGWSLRQRYRRLMAIGVQAPAQVVDRQARTTPAGDAVTSTYAPVVWFRTLDGQEMTAAARTSSNRMWPRRGETVSIHYDPAAPQNVVLDGFEGGGAQAMFIAAGGVFALAGLALIAGALLA